MRMVRPDVSRYCHNYASSCALFSCVTPRCSCAARQRCNNSTWSHSTSRYAASDPPPRPFFRDHSCTPRTSSGFVHVENALKGSKGWLPCSEIGWPARQCQCQCSGELSSIDSTAQPRQRHHSSARPSISDPPPTMMLVPIAAAPTPAAKEKSAEDSNSRFRI